MPPFEFYARLLGADGGRKRLLARLGPEAAEPIEAFLNQALAYEQRPPGDARGLPALARARQRTSSSATWSRRATRSAS